MNYKAKLHTIKAFVFDYDGVLSDGTIWIANKDIVMRSGNVKDGYAIQYAIKRGYSVAVLSGGSGTSITERMAMLGVDDVFISSASKKEVFLNYLKQKGLKKEEVLYMGDDIPDYDVMLLAGVATCPKDACEEIKQVSDYISIYSAGKGCARDVIEQVMRLHNQWFHEDGKEW